MDLSRSLRYVLGVQTDMYCFFILIYYYLETKKMNKNLILKLFEKQIYFYIFIFSTKHFIYKLDMYAPSFPHKAVLYSQDYMFCRKISWDQETKKAMSTCMLLLLLIVLMTF
jgi:hypothetical protein